MEDRRAYRHGKRGSQLNSSSGYINNIKGNGYKNNNINGSRFVNSDIMMLNNKSKITVIYNIINNNDYHMMITISGKHITSGGYNNSSGFGKDASKKTNYDSDIKK
mmetsp:Transcript_2839/g.3349  ORF Transcript_2839/g.3349 Transcript_2839/m.3349 type:complete len:106 (+) Transcript_2839:473-790(+)